jgi:hypothetical protein
MVIKILLVLMLAPVILIILLFALAILNFEFFQRSSVETTLPGSEVILTYTFIPKLSSVSPGDVQVSIRDPSRWFRRAWSWRRYQAFQDLSGATSTLYHSLENPNVFLVQMGPLSWAIDLAKFEILEYCEEPRDASVEEIGTFSFYERPDPQGKVIERLNFALYPVPKRVTARFGC